MKKHLKYSHIFFVTLGLLIVNAIPVIVFRDQIKISAYSLIAITVAAVVVFNGILACLFKHKGNFLIMRKHNGAIFSEDKDHTFTNRYECEFRRMLLIYCAAIPFYIPIICFASNLQEALWSLLVYSVPQIIFLVNEIRKTLKDVKKEKLHQAQLEKERIEQERREELGHWRK